MLVLTRLGFLFAKHTANSTRIFCQRCMTGLRLTVRTPSVMCHAVACDHFRISSLYHHLPLHYFSNAFPTCLLFVHSLFFLYALHWAHRFVYRSFRIQRQDSRCVVIFSLPAQESRLTSLILSHLLRRRRRTPTHRRRTPTHRHRTPMHLRAQLRSLRLPSIMLPLQRRHKQQGRPHVRREGQLCLRTCTHAKRCITLRPG